MYQIDVPTAATTQPASSALGTTGFFTDGNAATGVPATVVPAEFLNTVMLELMNAITGSGLTLSKSSFNQLYTALTTLQGNYNALTGAATQTLAPSQAGSVNVQIATGATSQVLPLSTGVRRGAKLDFINSTGVNMTLTCQGADGFILQGVVYTTVVLQPGEALTVASNAAGAWYGVGGNALNRYCAQFTASLASPGYQKIPGGFTFQWGVCTLPASGVNSASVAVTFPIAFANAAFVTGCATSTANTTAGGQPSFGAQNITKNGFTANGDALNYTTFNKACTCIWFAIGY